MASDLTHTGPTNGTRVIKIHPAVRVTRPLLRDVPISYSAIAVYRLPNASGISPIAEPFGSRHVGTVTEAPGIVVVMARGVSAVQYLDGHLTMIERNQHIIRS